jgi:hypothetical protein
MLTTTSASTVSSAVLACPANTKPMHASTHGTTTCHVRSPVRSECRAHTIIATTAAMLGTPVSNPVCSAVKPNCLTISGAQRPSVYSPTDVPK